MERAIRRTPAGLCAAALIALAAPRVAAQCTDDYLEDNDTCGQPTLVFGGFNATLTSVYGDDDYFQIYVADGESLTVDITFLHTLGDIDLYIYEPGCTSQLAASVSVTDDESVVYNNISGAGKDLIVLVTKYAPNPDIMCNDYFINFGISTPVLCQDDNEAGNQNNDNCGDANLVFDGVAYINMGVLDNDPDYYKIVVPAGSSLYVDLTFLHALGDIDVGLYDSNCTNLLANATSVTDDESMVWDNTSGAAMEVKWNVYLLAPATCNQYHMVASLVNPPCGFDDGWEENDSCQTAMPMGPGGYTSLLVDGADPDFYSYLVRQGETLDIDALFPHSVGDVDLNLWSACGGALLDSSTSISNAEHVTWTNNAGPDTDVILEVLIYGGVGCNRYDLSVGISNAEAGTNYCTSLANSSGFPGVMSTLGSASVGANDLVLFAQPLPHSQNGLFFYGPNQVQLPFGNGFRCVGGSLYRLPIRNSGGAGVMSFPVDYNNLPIAGPIAPGSSWNFQAWFRDPAAGGAFFNLSDGYHIAFLP